MSDLKERWQRLDVVIRDLPLALLVLAASFVPAFHAHGTQVGDLPARPFDALAVPAVLLECLPLALRRRAPLVCLALVVCGFALDQLRSYHLVSGMALAIVLVSTGVHLERFRQATIAVLTCAYVALAVTLTALGSHEGPTSFVTFYLLMALAWGIGAWLRSTRAVEAERRRLAEEAARSAERTRLARELHDVVTHHVTAMVVQAEAARYLTAAPERLDDTLRSVAETGRGAITDLRHLLDVLGPGDSEAPSVADIAALVEQTRRAGQPVELVELGEEGRTTSVGDRSGPAGSTAFRVVQEALTNGLKHAHGSRTVVAVHHGEEEITVEVGTDPSETPSPVPTGGGHGLSGLRERVEALAGEFSAEPRDDGGFVVRARIPVRSKR